MSTATLPAPVRLTPWPETSPANRPKVKPEGPLDAHVVRTRQDRDSRLQKSYEAAECLTYAAEAVVDAGHHGKAGVILSVATNILIRARYEAITGKAKAQGSKPGRILEAMRKYPWIETAEEVDQLADALGGAATTSPVGLIRVIATLRGVLDGLT